MTFKINHWLTQSTERLTSAKAAAYDDLISPKKNDTVNPHTQIGEPMKKTVKHKCPECGRSNILYRIKTDDFVCRYCGKTWPKKKI